MNNDEIETLDLDETIEMIDFFDTPKKSKNSDDINKILNSSNDNKTVKIDGNTEKLDEYKPTLRDLNIKSAKARKIVKKSLIYSIIVILIIFEIFINKSGSILNEIRVSAINRKLIKIKENDKYGFIDNTGYRAINPKYVYAEDFIGSYAIVKNSSNLSLVINKGGKNIIEPGVYFSLYRANNDIIASKVNDKELKYGILDFNLKAKTKFIYDNITFIDGVYTYIKGNDVGILNINGKEIYKYKLTDSSNKIIDVNASKNIDSDDAYCVVKVNDTSQIVNLKTGKVVLEATLNKVVPEENNVFYEEAYGEKLYMYVKDDKIIYESDNYLSMKVPSYKAGIIQALKKDYTYEYISTDTLLPIEKDLNENNAYIGQNVFLYQTYDNKNRINQINIVKEGKIVNSIPGEYTIYKGFSNGAAIIKDSDDKYFYINENGENISDTHFIEANLFDEFGHAIAKTEDGYGVINKNGSIIIPFENNEIKMANSNVKKKMLISSGNVFFAVRKNNLYALYDKTGKRVNKNIYYTSVTFDNEYPILTLVTNIRDQLYIPTSDAKINLTSSNEEYAAYDDYIIIKNEYYNYKGKLIYTDKNK